MSESLPSGEPQEGSFSAESSGEAAPGPELFNDDLEANEAEETTETLTPPGWTTLQHGGNTEKWDIDLNEVDEVTLTSDLPVVTREMAERDAESGADSARTFGRDVSESGGTPFELQIVFPAEDLSSRLGTLEGSEDLKSRLDDEDQDFVDRVYYRNIQGGRHPLVPSGEALAKIGQYHDDETGREVYVFVPGRLSELYAGEFDDSDTQQAEAPDPNPLERPPDTYSLTGEQVRASEEAETEQSGAADSNPLERQSDRYSLSGEEVKALEEGPAETEPDTAERAQDTIESLEDAPPKYAEKLSMTPLALDTMRDLLADIEQGYQDGNMNEQSPFQAEFIGLMRSTLEGLMEEAQPGESVTYDDLAWAAERAIGHIDKVHVDSILKDPSFVDEVNSIHEVSEAFAQTFKQRPDLEYIGNNIDSYTTHSAVHTYQKDRVAENPHADFHGERFGEDGRWISVKRGDMTVWVSAEQHDAVEAEIDRAEASHDPKTTIDAATDAEVREFNAPHEPNPEDTDAHEEMLAEIPDDERERILFAKDRFGGEFDPNNEQVFVAFVEKELAGLADQVPENSRYPDTVASVVGNGGPAWNYLRDLLAFRRNVNITNPNVFSSLPFSEVAAALEVDVEDMLPGYFDVFSPREMKAAA